MPLDRPVIPRIIKTPLGGEQIVEIPVDSNQTLNQREDWSLTLLRRLSLSPRFEVAAVDLLVWITGAGLVSNLLALAVQSGLLSTTALGVGLIVSLTPVAVWGTYLRRNYSGFQEVTGVRTLVLVVGVLLGALLAIL